MTKVPQPEPRSIMHSLRVKGWGICSSTNLSMALRALAELIIGEMPVFSVLTMMDSPAKISNASAITANIDTVERAGLDSIVA